jgi:hypothetical protein
VRKNRKDSINAKLEGLDRRWDLSLRYDAFEFDLGIRFEKGSPYSPFYYREIGAKVRHSRNHINLRVDDLDPADDLVENGGIIILPKDGWDYYKGNDVIVSFYQRTAARSLDAEINPVGREIGLTYTFSDNDLSPSGEREVNDAGVITNVFDKSQFHQVDVLLAETRRLPWFGHTFGLRWTGGWIDREVDDFFWFRIGSRPGLRGYTYYSIEGRSYVVGRATYRFPIFKSMDQPLLQLMFERLYGGIFAEAGIAWKRPVGEVLRLREIRDDIVRDVGFELRLDAVNFNTFPMRVHFEAAYPLDRVEIPADVIADPDLNEILIGEDGEPVVLSKQEWKFYFGILFGY